MVPSALNLSTMNAQITDLDAATLLHLFSTLSDVDLAACAQVCLYPVAFLI